MRNIKDLIFGKKEDKETQKRMKNGTDIPVIFVLKIEKHNMHEVTQEQVETKLFSHLLEDMKYSLRIVADLLKEIIIDFLSRHLFFSNRTSKFILIKHITFYERI